MKRTEKEHANFQKTFHGKYHLKRELAINTREGIIRNNFYLNSFACCPEKYESLFSLF